LSIYKEPDERETWSAQSLAAHLKAKGYRLDSHRVGEILDRFAQKFLLSRYLLRAPIVEGAPVPEAIPHYMLTSEGNALWRAPVRHARRPRPFGYGL